MSRLVALQDAIVADFKTAITGIKDIEPHGGQFDEKDLSGRTIRPPALRVSVLGAPNIGENSNANIKFAARVVVVVVDKSPADAMAMAERVAIAAHQKRFGDLTHIGFPSGLTIGAVMTDQGHTKGISIWAVTWRQEISTDAGLYEKAREGLADTIAEMIVDGESIGTGEDP